jgi:hypothetical protein
MVSLLIKAQLSFTSHEQETNHLNSVTIALNLQSESCGAIHPYVILSTYRLLVCQICGFASVADEVATHLRTRHRDIQPQHRQDLVEKIEQMPDVFRSRDKIRRYLQYPTDLIQPIPYLAPPEPQLYA